MVNARKCCLVGKYVMLYYNIAGIFSKLKKSEGN